MYQRSGRPPRLRDGSGWINGLPGNYAARRRAAGEHSTDGLSELRLNALVEHDWAIRAIGYVSFWIPGSSCQGVRKSGS